MMLSAAVTIRTLCHTTGRSTSLLAQLGITDQFPFIDGLPDWQREMLSRGRGFLPGLALVELGQDDAQYVPVFRQMPHERRVSLEEWWKTPVSRDTNGNTFTRRNLVLATANKDGGGHVDLNKGEYANVPRDGFPGIRFGAPSRPDGYNPSPVPAMMRQIVEEVRIAGDHYLAERSAHLSV